MAKTPPPVVPRSVNVSVTTSDDVPAGAQLRAQSGVVQLRDFDRAGRAWKETYRTVRTRDVDDMEWLARLQWFRARSKRFWIDHQLLNGSGQPILGNARENLVRDAAMDADSDGDGLVDSFAIGGQDSDWTLSLNGTEGAQVMTADGTGSSGNRVFIDQWVLRVFPGDDITVAIEAKLANSPTDIRGEFEIAWVGGDPLGTGIGVSNPEIQFTNTTYQRQVHNLTAPADAGGLIVRLVGRTTADGGSGDVRWRDARVIRATSEPSSWHNPHVSGASQTGDTLDTAGWPTDTRIFEPGDVFRIGGSAESKAAAETDEVITSFKVLAPVDSDGSGNATIPIDPPIFAGQAPPDGAALRFENMRLRAGLVGGNLRRPSKLVNKYGGLSAVFVEAL